ncbi:hypothetical protein OHA79_03890 [Streptomyces sp. NBC_00841]|nr:MULTISPECIES: hypothetical protein [unclassified Streptomyces]MCX4537642.1 hypothetical protein [Streptomyces sp. NBC_01669]WRZ97130.1 hypothetical protein OHA79_03890 [Streptomyces sp. NBC_00841]
MAHGVWASLLWRTPYFKDGGRRADGLVVEFTEIDYIELDYS